MGIYMKLSLWSNNDYAWVNTAKYKSKEQAGKSWISKKRSGKLTKRRRYLKYAEKEHMAEYGAEKDKCTVESVGTDSWRCVKPFVFFVDK